MNLKYMKVSLFEITCKKKWTFSRHSNSLRCTCNTWCVDKGLGIRIKWLYLAGVHRSLISLLCLYRVECSSALTYVASSTSFCTLDVHKHCDSMLLQVHQSAPRMCIRALCRFVWSVSHDQSFAYRKTITSLSSSHDFYLISMNIIYMYFVRIQIVNRINLFKLYNVHQRFFFKI